MMFMLCGLMWYCRKAAKEMEDKKKERKFEGETRRSAKRVEKCREWMEETIKDLMREIYAL